MNYTEEDIACFGVLEEQLKECGHKLLSYDYSHKTFESSINLCIEIETALFRARIKLLRQIHQK